MLLLTFFFESAFARMAMSELVKLSFETGVSPWPRVLGLVLYTVRIGDPF